MPLPFILRELGVTSQTTWESLLAAFHRRMCERTIPLDALRKLILDGQAVLLFDGLDEIGLDARDNLRRILWELIEKAPKCVVICTSRPVGYEEAPFDREVLEKGQGTSGKGQGGEEGEDIDEINTSGSLAPARDVKSAKPRRRGGEGGGEGAPATGIHPLTPTLSPTAESLDDSSSIVGEREQELRQRYGEMPHIRQHMTRLYMAPFDDSQIRAFIDHWYNRRIESKRVAADRTEGMWLAVAAGRSTHTLARIPNILTIMAILHERRNVLPDGRAKLYQCVAEAYLVGIDQARALPQWHEFRATLVEQKLWLGRIAWEIQLRRAANDERKKDDRTPDAAVLLVTHEELVGWIADEQQQINDWSANSTTEIEAFIKNLQERAGLLIERGERRYGFAHLSFVEYFAGFYLLHRFPTLLPSLGDQTVLTVSLAGKTIWHEVLVYAFEEGKELAPLLWPQLRAAFLGWFVKLAASGAASAPRDTASPDEKATAAQSNQWILLARLGEDRHAGFLPQRELIRNECIEWGLQVDPLSASRRLIHPNDQFLNRLLSEFDDEEEALVLRCRLIQRTVTDEGRTLRCYGFYLGFAGAREIAQRLPNLTTLSLWDNQIGGAGAREIAQRLPNLTSLNLEYNQIGDAGAREIAQRLPHLTSLDLRRNKISKAVQAELLEQLSGRIKNLWL